MFRHYEYCDMIVAQYDNLDVNRAEQTNLATQFWIEY